MIHNNKMKVNNPYDAIRVKLLTQSITNVNSLKTSVYKLLLDKNTKYIILVNMFSGYRVQKNSVLKNIKFMSLPITQTLSRQLYLPFLQNTDIKLHVPTILMKLISLVIFEGVKTINNLIAEYIQLYPEEANVQNNSGNTALHILLNYTNKLTTEHVHLANILIDATDCKIQDDYGQTPLHRYCSSNHCSDIILEALVRKSDVNMVDINKLSCIKYCSLTENKINIIYYLIKNGANFSFNDLQINSIIELKDIIEKGIITLHTKDEHGENLVFHAVRLQNVSLLEYLVDNNVSINELDNYGISALMLEDTIKNNFGHGDHHKICKLLGHNVIQ